jgi:hypothetical protein
MLWCLVKQRDNIIITFYLYLIYPFILYYVSEADHSPPSSAEVKECVELYLHSPIHFHGVMLSLGTGCPCHTISKNECSYIIIFTDQRKVTFYCNNNNNNNNNNINMY